MADLSKRFPDVPLAFHKWLYTNIGQCKWVVARSNKSLRKNGYDRFFTQKRFAGLMRQFEKENTAMPDRDLQLTEPNKDLGDKRRRTPHGMAFWAGTGPEGKSCRECLHWQANGYLVATGLLKDSHCGKYTRMMNGEPGGRLPHYTSSCKYFEQDPIERRIEGP